MTLADTAIRISATGNTDYTQGVIENVVLGSFDIAWTKIGTGAIGTILLRFVVQFHD